MPAPWAAAPAACLSPASPPSSSRQRLHRLHECQPHAPDAGSVPGQPGDPAEDGAQVRGAGLSQARFSACPAPHPRTPVPVPGVSPALPIPRLPAGSRRLTSSVCGTSTGAWWRGCGRPAPPGRPTPTWPTPCCPTRCCRVSPPPLCPRPPRWAPGTPPSPPPTQAEPVSPQRRCRAPSARPSTSWASCGGCWSTSSGGCGCSTWCRRARPPSSAAWPSASASSASPSGSSSRVGVGPGPVWGLMEAWGSACHTRGAEGAGRGLWGQQGLGGQQMRGRGEFGGLFTGVPGAVQDGGAGGVTRPLHLCGNSSHPRPHGEGRE